MISYASTHVVTVPQYGTIPGIRLSDIRPDLLNMLLGKYVALSSRNSINSLSALGNIGVLQLASGILLNIVPRFRTRNLTYMVDECNGSYVSVIDDMPRDYYTGQSAQEWLQTILKAQYVKRCSSLHITGLLRGYRRRNTITSSPFGRIDIGRSLALRARGITGRLACSYEERTIDIPENSCIRLALAESVLPDRPNHERERKHLLELFDGVSHLGRYDCLVNDVLEGHAALPENWRSYRELLDMAWLILQKGSLLLEGLPLAGRRMPSLCVDFQHLFEEYIRLSIRKRFSGRYQVFDGNSSAGKAPLYEKVSSRNEYAHMAEGLIPPLGMTADCDVIIKDRNADKVVIAAECKCTYLDSSGITKREEAEQAVVYAVRFGLPYALVIHPVVDPGSSGLYTPGRIGSVTLLQYNININADSMRDETDAMLDSLEQLLNVFIEKRLEINTNTV